MKLKASSLNFSIRLSAVGMSITVSSTGHLKETGMKKRSLEFFELLSLFKIKTYMPVFVFAEKIII